MAKNFESRNLLRNTSATLLLSLLIACGQNAHVTSKDPAVVPVGSPITHTDEPGTSAGGDTQTPGGVTVPTDPGTGGGGGVSNPTHPVQPATPACYELVKYKYPLQGVSRLERKSLELPYHQAESRIRTLRTDGLHTITQEIAPVRSSCARSCGPDLTPTQFLLKAEINNLPSFELIGRIRKAEVALKIIRPRTSLHGSELFCLLNERLCSGTRGAYYVNDKFWHDLSDNEIKYMKTQYVDQIKNDKIWESRKRPLPGQLSDKFVLDLVELARGTRHDLKQVIVPGSFEPSKTLFFGIADDVDTCSGELLIELEVNKCPPVDVNGGVDGAQGSSS